MANSKIKKIASVERPKMVGINDFNQNKPYTQADTISPNGRDPDSAGNVGTSIDIAERNKQTAKNIYSKNNIYRVDD